MRFRRHGSDREFRSGFGHRRHLRHRIFFALGFTIVLSVAVAGMVVHTASENTAELAALRHLDSERFAAVWDNSRARDELALSLERHFDLRIAVVDSMGTPVYGAKGQCPTRAYERDIQRDGRLLGHVQACISNRHLPRSVLIGLASVVLVLWAMSGFIARSLVRSLDELVRVARDIGNGRLGARIQLCGRVHRGEVGEVAVAINQMAEKIERQVVGQRELLAAVSHEIRSPLARLRMLVELEREARRELDGDLVRDNETDDDAIGSRSAHEPNNTSTAKLKRLDGMDVELTEMDRLVGQLLAQSRLEFQKVDLRAIDAAELAHTALSRSGQPVSKLVDLAPNVRVLVDATLFTRGLLNLIDNAERHAGGLVELRLEPCGACVRFVVRDRGPGFDPNLEKQAFLPFIGSGKATGLGLGLALVAQIARAHGTDVYLNSTAQGADVGIDARLASEPS